MINYIYECPNSQTAAEKQETKRVTKTQTCKETQTNIETYDKKQYDTID